MTFVRIVGALLVAVLIALPAHAKKKADGVPVYKADEDTGYVQLRTMMVPVFYKKNGRRAGNAPVTAVFETPDKDNTSFICRNSPRIIDAMLQVFYKNPVQMNAKRQIDLIGLDKLIAAKSNKVLRKKVISRVFLFGASRPIGDTSGVVSKLPFSSVLGCRVAKTDEQEKKSKK